MLIYNTAAFVSALYAMVYFAIFSIFLGAHPLFLFLSFALGDITLRWLIILVSNESGNLEFRWMPGLIKNLPPAVNLPQFFLKRLFVPGFGGTLFFLPVWGYGVFFFVALLLDPKYLNS